MAARSNYGRVPPRPESRDRETATEMMRTIVSCEAKSASVTRFAGPFSRTVNRLDHCCSTSPPAAPLGWPHRDSDLRSRSTVALSLDFADRKGWQSARAAKSMPPESVWQPGRPLASWGDHAVAPAGGDQRGIRPSNRSRWLLDTSDGPHQNRACHVRGISLAVAQSVRRRASRTCFTSSADRFRSQIDQPISQAPVRRNCR